MTDAPVGATRPAPRVTALLTLLALLAFAGNSLLCRAALRGHAIDAAGFTAIRIASGAAMLAAIVAWRRGALRPAGNWTSAFALFAYAACFSYAYVALTAATGALLLFGAVQATMVFAAWRHGEPFGARTIAGLLIALGGLLALLLPGVAAPPPVAAGLMLAAGGAWGVYSLRGRGSADPLGATAGNFVRAVPMALALLAMAWPHVALERSGVAAAIASGAITSGLGYAIWYTALRGLGATAAATVQLAVPALAAFGGVALLGEPMQLRLVLASIAILGGIAMVVVRRRTPP